MKTTLILSALLTLCFVGPARMAEGADKAVKILEVDENTKKLEVRHSMIGFRSTLLFYTFDEQKTVLRLQFGNRDKTFPVSATAYIFDNGVTEAGLKKWLNNQHSDGLFPDVPQPVNTLKLPEKVCKVTSNKLLDNTKQRNGNFANYAVTFEVKDYTDKASIKVKGFKGNTKVHVKFN